MFSDPIFISSAIITLDLMYDRSGAGGDIYYTGREMVVEGGGCFLHGAGPLVRNEEVG